MSGILRTARAIASIAFLAVGTNTVFAGSHGKEVVQPSAVVEMFTSQGCSSCPPADKVLSEYAADKNVLALSWHVDYWNYLGWKDTFSKAEFTERQQHYAVSFRRRGVYTPQAVVNGRDHVVGSRKSHIEKLMKTYNSTGEGLTVPLDVKLLGDRMRVSSAPGADTGKATLYVIYFDRKKSVSIKRGENRGREIEYHNIVREVSMLGMAEGGKLDVSLPLAEMKRKGHDACAIILQQSSSNGFPGPIIGASVVNYLADS